MRGEYKRISSEQCYKGKHMQVFRDEIVFPNGKEGVYEHYKKNDIVVIVPVYKNKYVLIEQYRYLANARMTEFPMGLLHEGEDVTTAGIRELKEETGLIAQPDEITYLGKCMLNKGATSQVCHFIAAKPQSIDSVNFDDSESDIDIIYVEPKKIQDMIKKSKIFDAPTMIGFMFNNIM